MAHECPECGQICYCSGDIDDVLLDYYEEISCIHCTGKADPEPQEEEEE